MILEMKIPSPGESITEVEIATWLVSNGDFVEKDQAIAEVDSDKATLELPAEESGIITLKVEEGDTIAVGAVVCHIDTSVKNPEGKQKEKNEYKEDNKAQKSSDFIENRELNTPNSDDSIASPSAQKIIDENDLSISKIKGSGKGGRIIKEDALIAVSSMGTPGLGARSKLTKKMSMLRRKVAERLVTVKNETAMLTTFNEVDMSAIFTLRKKFKEEFKEKHGVSLGFMSFFTKAVVRALKLFPDVNSMIDGVNKITFEYIDISIAVSGPKGLMVPVLRNAENLTFRGIESEIKRLALLVRDGQISVDEMTGGTFTITNGGVFGSMLSTPIINPPQSAILGMHNIVERPVAINGNIEIRPIMYIALSYDHRIIDGRESVGFLVAVKEALESPIEILLSDKNKIRKEFEL